MVAIDTLDRGQRFVWGDSLVVFDEGRCFPPTCGLLKYLVEDGRYDYLETGSLPPIRQNAVSPLP